MFQSSSQLNWNLDQAICKEEKKNKYTRFSVRTVVFEFQQGENAKKKDFIFIMMRNTLGATDWN